MRRIIPFSAWYAPCMCLIVFACNTHPDFPLILVANRDEFYARPTQPAHFWLDHRGIFAGRDQEILTAGEQGTWMGVNTQGRFAAVTNFREMDFNEPASKRSRGELTANFLCAQTPVNDYLNKVQAEGGNYKGFNLLLWEAGQLFYTSNRMEHSRKLPAGIYGLSNGLLDSPWPKVQRAKQQLQLQLQKKFSADSLVSLLNHREPAPDEQLPDTGIDIESERLLSSCFIHSEHYGTRSTSVLLIDKNGRITFLEQNWNEKGKAEEQRFLEFNAELTAKH